MVNGLQTITLLSLLGSWSAVNFGSGYLPFRPSYVGSFVLLWTIFGLGGLFYKIVIHHRFFSPLRHLPDPRGGSWWNGHAKRIYTEANGFPASDWLRSTPHKDMFRYLGVLNSERIVVTSPEALSEVCSRNYDFPKSRQATFVAGELLGRGLVLTDGDEHKRQRKMLLPAFASKHIKALYPVYWSKAKEATAKLTAIARNHAADDQGAAIEIGEWASRAALDVITLAALGLDFGAIADPQTKLNRTYRMVFEPTRMFQFFSLLKLVIPSWIVHRIPLKRNIEVMKAVRDIKETCRQLVRTKRAEIASDKPPRKDLLSLVLQSENLSEGEAVDQMMTFLAAGHETVSVAITWAIYMLCKYPEYQSRLRAEVRSLLPSPDVGSDETPVDLDRAVQLTAFCNEVLRYWPPIPLTAREAAQDTTLCGQFIPKGTKIILTIVGTNRDERLWGADAREFRPERWLTAEGKLDATGGAVSKYANMTFNHGPRMCIGQGFARAEMAYILAAWIGRFEFALQNEKDRDESTIKISGGGFSAKPADGLWVKMRAVDGW